MGVSYNPSIVTNGLVLCLDAANKKSYPGTGTVWTDLSGNGNAGTLVNSPTYSSANGGTFTTTGLSSQYINTNYIMPVSNFTINIMYQCTSFSPWATLWASEVWTSATGYLAYFGSGGSATTLSFQAGNGIGISTTVDSSKLNYYTFALSSDTTAKIYVNGILYATGPATITTVTKSILLGTRHSNDGTSNINDNKAATIPFFSVYNRVLLADEIQQNFNALRGRYGI